MKFNQLGKIWFPVSDLSNVTPTNKIYWVKIVKWFIKKLKLLDNVNKENNYLIDCKIPKLPK